MNTCSFKHISLCPPSSLSIRQLPALFSHSSKTADIRLSSVHLLPNLDHYEAGDRSLLTALPLNHSFITLLWRATHVAAVESCVVHLEGVPFLFHRRGGWNHAWGLALWLVASHIGALV